MVPLSAAISMVGTMSAVNALGIEVPGDMIGATAAVASGIFIWKLHHWLADHKPALSIVDDETGESAPLEIKHDFYWIPLKYWGLIFSIGGILTAVNTIYPGIFRL